MENDRPPAQASPGAKFAELLHLCHKFEADVRVAMKDGRNKEFIRNCMLFYRCRRQLQELWISESDGRVESIPSVDYVQLQPETFNGNLRQTTVVDGSVVETFPDLFAAAKLARESLNTYLSTVLQEVDVPDTPEYLILPSLKGILRATEKAKDDYGSRSPGPALSWLFDIVRASIVCDDSDQIYRLLNHLLTSNIPADCHIGDPDWITKHSSIGLPHICRLKNRFVRSTPGGFRDININIRLPIGINESSGETIFHICEIQIHHRKILQLGKDLHSHDVYDFFRKYFSGSAESTEKCMSLISSVVATKLQSAKDEEVEGVVERDGGCDDGSVDPGHGHGGDDISLGLTEYVHHYMLNNQASTNTSNIHVESIFSLLILMCEYSLCRDLRSIEVQLAELSYGPEHEYTLIKYNNLAVQLLNMDEWESAKDIFQRVLDGYFALDNGNGIYDCAIIELYNNLSIAYKEQGNFAESKRLLELALEHYHSVAESDCSASREQVREKELDIHSMVNMGNVLEKLGDFPGSRKAHGMVVEKFQLTLGADHPIVLGSIYNMGRICLYMTDFMEGKLLLEKALAGFQRLYGPDNVQTLAVKSVIGHMYQKLGDRPTAISVLQSVLADKERVLGPNHSSTLNEVAYIAPLLQELGNLGEAKLYFVRALTGLTKLLGAEHPQVMLIESNLATLLRRMGDCESAYKLFLHSREVLTKSLPLTHQDMLQLDCSIATLTAQMGDMPKGEELLLDVLSRCESAHGPGAVLTANIQSDLGFFYTLSKRYDQSERYFRLAVASYVVKLGETHPITFGAMQKVQTFSLYSKACSLIGSVESQSLLSESVTCDCHPHPLRLVETVPYPGGLYGCDVCHVDGIGWALSCRDCGFDVHPTCVPFGPTKEN